MHDTLDLPDLDQCAREPIAFLDHIQSFGFLIGLTNDWTIIRASANLQEFLGTEAAHAIGMKVDRLIAQPALHDVRNRLAGLTGESGTERLYGVRLTTDRRLFDLALHYAGDILVIEGEPCGTDQPSDAATLVRSMMVRLQAQALMPAMLRDAVRQVRAITGFDRAMIYRFHDDGVGEVIAEAARSPADPLLGLHYPASDIPGAVSAQPVPHHRRRAGDDRRDPAAVAVGAAARPVARDHAGGVADAHRISAQHGRRCLAVDLDHRRGAAVGADRLPPRDRADTELRHAQRSRTVRRDVLAHAGKPPAESRHRRRRAGANFCRPPDPDGCEQRGAVVRSQLADRHDRRRDRVRRRRGVSARRTQRRRRHARPRAPA
jgi:hypothetical protein